MLKKEKLDSPSEKILILGQLKAFEIDSPHYVLRSTDLLKQYVDKKLEEKKLRKTKANRQKIVNSLEGTAFYLDGEPFAYLIL